MEPFEELKKSFHAGGNMLASIGIHNFTKYNVMTCNDARGSFLQDKIWKSLVKNLDIFFSDIDKTASNLFFSAKWLSIANADAIILCMCYAHNAYVMVIVDGQIVAPY